MKRAVFEKDFIRVEDSETGTPGAFLKFAFRVQAALYKLRYRFVHVKPQDKKYNVAVCAIFKNEAPYLKEWIEFNHLVGVEHFYLCNNNSEDDYQSVLEEYVQSGLVTLIQFPYEQAQMKCYKDCIDKYAGETKWLGFIDIDEFIVPKSTNDIYGFLKPFETKRGAVKLNWQLFGTSGRMDRDIEGLVAEDFTVCWPKYYDVGKCFYNTAFGVNPDSPQNAGMHHSFWTMYKGRQLPPVNAFDHVCTGTFSKADSRDFPIQLNHYFTKSYQEYVMKRSKGDVFFKTNPHDEEYFYFHENLCTAQDHSAYKYLIRLKQQMNRK